ncbi:MAG: oxidase [Candidatus Omnitrophica bacterium CG11_big_fil_rev_8_21_14_0_20_45_26]|uniref:Oxidase n=1 Tax=Candidatus Abzuiibacterium crystallinum TaxID=1974748 RepID=A0A2H0LNI5_9BACT|nr:MAG: oxidase [Candidatus Omnitrophica bacterium CG11_big_fil_rev_8_21_14_0_20_45_26]PIW63868.1 MAG: oxidase [Candidatus Omnitrophica bacterium CG12_big_fil_rev_8_21_14_0_65_45_16]
MNSTHSNATQKQYLIIFGWLGVLTLLEIGAVMFKLPHTALVIFILGTAASKAILIALYFMHLKFESRLTWLLPGIPVVLGLIFIFALFPDMVYQLTWKL